MMIFAFISRPICLESSFSKQLAIAVMAVCYPVGGRQ